MPTEDENRSVILAEIVSRNIEQRLLEIYSQRGEILEAFIAKYGFSPEEAVQEEQIMPDGTTRWRIVRSNETDTTGFVSLMASVCLSNGGEIRIPDVHLDNLRGNETLEVFKDMENRCTIVRVTAKTVKKNR